MIELKLLQDFPREIIALDEVGRSPLCGPVVIGAVRLLASDRESLTALLRSLRRYQVKDSKALTHQKRQIILQKLGVQELPFRERGSFELRGIQLSYLTWNMEHDVIDRENILQASLRGMKEAALALVAQQERASLLIDGHLKLRWQGDAPAWQELPIIKGDCHSPLIGLAAIIAKEKRDAWMRQMHVSYPQYGLESNFGYPTRFHRQAIAEHGPSPIHRLSFNKVKEFLPQK
jgi:ribonuclease HII